MTISDKIRIYELSRDLNLENKDILDAAQKLSISVKSHSSSISAEDARLRELYPLPEDDEEYGQNSYEEETFTDSDQLETVQDSEISAKEERKR